ncbi:cofactor assembly of complex C subunit B [Leptolyngbyaceae cyanobacterium CCMR0082]|uniref:Cofactor assembly of complex C subunit B n=2 Tax=Adonisia TaxID=2950183 RepID=A0A6M0SEW9_9CYAN|nr:cofactor assembly of complex C subunit B [Adonisia turfae]MDV3352450.1 cofactor assembly of complex C subunit B [Leptothoe sp. LEGE 181152]NEZ66866.1 cofactor assembly of complex C subunit B [Adonisia turfae CCMR0082]
MAKAANDNQWLRRLPLIVGSVGGTLLMLNRLLTPVVTDSQARADVVGVFLSAILILTTLLWRQIQPVPPEAVILEGEEGFELADGLSEDVATELAWASHLLLTNTVTRSLVAYYDGQTLMRRGILGPNKEVEVGPIMERTLTRKQPVYLVNLKLYPGKVEFNYLPENTQGIICQPMGEKGVLVLGANAPRSYTKQDESWVEGIADKLGASLDTQATREVKA